MKKTNSSFGKSTEDVRSQILRTNTSQFASGKSLAPNFYQKLITQKRNANQIRNLYQRLINFARGYSCAKEGLKTFEQILKKSLKYLNTTFTFCNSLLYTYSGTCTIEYVSYWEQGIGRAVLPLDDSKQGPTTKSLFK